MSGLEKRLEDKINELINKLIMKLKMKSDFEELRDTFSKNHIFWEKGKKKFSIFKFFF